jgi:hypothetical protein
MAGLKDLAYLPSYLPDPNDRSKAFNTVLSPEQEAQFQRWAIASGRIADLYDYDLRGAWLMGAAKAGGHLPDTFKKPNHPTFSDESKYHGPGAFGGHWQGDTFQAQQQNLRGRSLADLLSYFQQVEPGVRLIPPKGR